MKQRYQIALLFNANKIYDREVIKGIGEYLQASQCEWDIYHEEDFITNLDHIKDWDGDGIIADFDNPEVVALLNDVTFPVVAVGSSYQDKTKYPPVPYVATDNNAVIDLAFQHLKEKGIENYAFYGITPNPHQKWAYERELAFIQTLEKEAYNYTIYHSSDTLTKDWEGNMDKIAAWLQSLPSGTGIIAVTDTRAQYLLQICDHIGVLVPDNIAIVGVDNEELARYLSRTSLSSVEQGCSAMGYRAAKLLHNQLINPDAYIDKEPARIIVPPTKVYQRQSTDFQALKDPYVIQAMHYIRHNACKGIKVDQVLSAVGISRSNLEGRFKEERKHSIHQELHDTKLKKASTLLSETNIPISEIAEQCGYPSLQYMYSVFKKSHNKTPKEFRDCAIISQE